MLQPTPIQPSKIYRPIIFRDLVFYFLFFLIFCFSGLVSLISPIPFRLAIMSLVVIPVIIAYGIKIDPVFFTYLLIVIVIALSAIYNKASFKEFILFLRIPTFAYLIYYLVAKAFTRENSKRVIKICLVIGVIQLPIILLQWSLYDYFPTSIQQRVIIEDFGFGTFNFKTDYAMAFFLTGLVAFLLFEKDRVYFVRYRWPLIFWYTLTVFVANAQIMKLALILIWGVFLVLSLRKKYLFKIIPIVILLIFSLSLLSRAGFMTESATTFLDRLNFQKKSAASVDAYLAGEYSRFGAFNYFLNNEVLWLGDGPSRYSDVLARQLFRGNTGHVFTFYSEVGLIGWVVSIAFFGSIVFPVKNYRIRINTYRILLFISINMLSFTSQIMNDIGVVFIFCLLSNVNLIPLRIDPISGNNSQSSPVPAHE